MLQLLERAVGLGERERGDVYDHRPLRHLERQEPTLEQVFMKLTQGLVQ